MKAINIPFPYSVANSTQLYACGEHIADFSHDTTSRNNGIADAANAAAIEKATHLVISMSMMACQCQRCARDVETNMHLPSCLVGQAQELCGKQVTIGKP